MNWTRRNDRSGQFVCGLNVVDAGRSPYRSQSVKATPVGQVDSIDRRDFTRYKR